jgi:hypothetical protein
MATNEHGVRSKWFGAAVLLWAALGLLWAQVILLPNPLLPPPLFAELLGDIPSSTHPQRFIVMIFKATSLLLTGFALCGMFMAAAAEFAGARWSPLCAAAVAVSLVRAWQEASAEGVSLSLPGYFAGPVVASSIVAERNLPCLRAGPRRERHAPHQTLRKTIPKRMRWPASRCRVRRSLQRSEALIRPGERARHLARASPPQATSRCLLNGSARCGNTRSPAECHQSTSE